MKTKVDNDDYQLLSIYKWYFDGARYAIRTEKINGKTRSFGMSRQIMKPSKGMVVDHINGDGLDNRRKNLRICTHIQNMQNQRLTKRNTSGVKGVCWHSRDKKWQARIRVNTKLVNLGYFMELEDAKKAYEMAAKEHFGEFVKINKYV